MQSEALVCKLSLVSLTNPSESGLDMKVQIDFNGVNTHQLLLRTGMSEKGVKLKAYGSVDAAPELPRRAVPPGMM